MKIQAFYVGQRIRISKFMNQVHYKELRLQPALMKVGRSFYMALFPYGVVVFWGGKSEQIIGELQKIEPFIIEKRQRYFSEELAVIVSDRFGDKVTERGVCIAKADHDRIAIVSEILARSLALEFFEKEIENSLRDHDEVLVSFSRTGKTRFSSKTLLKKAASSMRIQHLCMGQMAMLDKPDLTWENTHLDSFYNLLKIEYEINERYLVLNQKLQGLVQSAEFILNYIETKRSNFLEFVIVVLIVVEIVLAMMGVME